MAAHQAVTHAPPFPSVRVLMLGGGASEQSLIDKCHHMFPKLLRLAGAYGMTEACSTITWMDLQEHPSLIPAPPPGAVCVGRPCPHAEVAVVVPARGGGGLQVEFV
jgi:acyl-CoA synthetase (AMP-forming)/AMP-acid ligase II